MNTFVERVVTKQKWDAPGEQIEGVLVDMRVVEYDDKEKGGKQRKMVYKLLTPDGGLILFGGTADLNQKIGARDKGLNFRITYTGESASVSKNGNAMKIFTVEVARAEKANIEAGLEITDDDIPF